MSRSMRWMGLVGAMVVVLGSPMAAQTLPGEGGQCVECTLVGDNGTYFPFCESVQNRPAWQECVIAGGFCYFYGYCGYAVHDVTGRTVGVVACADEADERGVGLASLWAPSAVWASDVEPLGAPPRVGWPVS